MINTLKKTIAGVVIASFALSLIACSSEKELNIDPELHQAVFATPEEAAQVFADAVIARDKETLAKLLGENYQDVLPVAEVPESDVNAFVYAWKKEHELIARDDKTQFIAVGEDQWTMPIPLIINEKNEWYFDIQEGHYHMAVRRIGKNELHAIQAVLTYLHAQKEYAETDHDGDGVLEYAQKMFSTPGVQDGLLWSGNSNHYATELASLLAAKEDDGSYHGYNYKVLFSDSSESYMVDNSMTKGFALIAWPTTYGESGIMTFLLGKDGVVYEQDFGDDTADIAAKIIAYQPDNNWRKTDEESLKP